MQLLQRHSMIPIDKYRHQSLLRSQEKWPARTLRWFPTKEEKNTSTLLSCHFLIAFLRKPTTTWTCIRVSLFRKQRFVVKKMFQQNEKPNMQNEKLKENYAGFLIHEISISNFKLFCWNILIRKNLLFLKSGLLV